MDAEGITFTDLDNGDEAYCGVRRVPGGVGIAMSLRSNGDIEVFMTTAGATELAELLARVAAIEV